MATRVVSLERDLRVDDQAPRAEPARRGPVVALCVLPPRVHAASDFSRQPSAHAILGLDS